MVDLSKSKGIPKDPGVYLFKKKEKVIYVGKAKSLNKRVSSYYQKSNKKTNKTKLLVANATSCDWIICDSEVDALLLEANLIKKYKPYYNVLLKDDKTFPFIRITNEPFPKVEIIRSKNLVKDKNLYFGPYTNIGYLRSTVRILHKIFKLRTCSFYFDNKIIREKKYSICLDYHINKCDGPCEGYISEKEYRGIIDKVIKFLKGDGLVIKAEIKSLMLDASSNLDFELATQYREQLYTIDSFLKKQKKICQEFVNRDVVAIVNDRKIAVTVVMKIRNGNLVGIEKFELKGLDVDDFLESLRQFLIQYYFETTDLPNELLVNIDIDEFIDFTNWFYREKQKKIKILQPKRGKKFNLIKNCIKNAKDFLKVIKKDKVKKSLKVSNAINILKIDLQLETFPLRIEAFDISNISGYSSVGAMVSFVNGVNVKSEYRKYIIKSVSGVDDFASIREVVSRRYSRVIKDKGELPDLILIDGGKGQLSAAKSALDSIGLGYLSVIGLAKRLEEVFLPGCKEPQNISKSSPSIMLLRKIRDEVHRFAIATHRSSRNKKMVESKFLSIKGVGVKVIQRLWKEFSTIDDIKRTTIKQIAKRVKVSIEIASEIKKIA